MQVKAILKIILNYTFKMVFFNILTIKCKTFIILIIVKKKLYFQYIKKNSWLLVIFFDIEQ